MLPPPSQKYIEVAIALVFDPTHRLLLICRRKPETVLGGYWEFPGGKCEAGEALDACARREVMEELGVEVQVIKKLPLIEHRYPHATVRLHPFVCEWQSGKVRLLAVADARWIDPAEAPQFQFPEANGGLVKAAAAGYAAIMA